MDYIISFRGIFNYNGIIFTANSLGRRSCQGSCSSQVGNWGARDGYGIHCGWEIIFHLDKL